MVATAVAAVEILAGLAAAGVSIDELITRLKAKGETEHAATLENLKAAGTPTT
jgi:hypothetical protein